MSFVKSDPYYEFEKLLSKWKRYYKDNKEFLEIESKSGGPTFIHGVKMRIVMCEKIISDLEQTIQKAKNNRDSTMTDNQLQCKNMSILYPSPETIQVAVNIETNHDTLDVIEPDTITFYFTCDGGKFGTDESLAEYTLTPKELLDILYFHHAS